MSDFDGNLTPAPAFDDVPLLSTTAVALGGPSGAMNAQARALAARTALLKQTQDPMVGELADARLRLAIAEARLNQIKYPDGIVPFLDIDFTAGVLHPAVTFSRASETTYFDANGVLRTAGVNEPAFDHDPETGKPLGLQRFIEYTNRYLNSNTPVGSGFATSYSIVNGNTPDGKGDMSFISETASNSDHGRDFNLQASGGKQTWTFFVKSAGRTKIAVSPDYNTIDRTKIIIDLVTGGVTGSLSNTCRVSKLPDGWRRVDVSHELPTATPTSRIWFMSDDSGTIVYPGDTTKGIYIWGMQSNNGPASPYIKTASTQVTRAREGILINNAKNDDSEFSAVYRGRMVIDSRMNTPFFDMSFPDSTQIRPFLGSAQTRMLLNSRGGTGDIPVDVQSTLPVTNVALSATIQSVTMAANGKIGGANGRPGSVSRPVISLSRSDISTGWIESFQLYSRALPDAKLQALSAL